MELRPVLCDVTAPVGDENVRILPLLRLCSDFHMVASEGAIERPLRMKRSKRIPASAPTRGGGYVAANGRRLTTGDVMRYCCVSRATVLKWIKLGKLRGYMHPDTGSTASPKTPWWGS